MGVSYDIWPFKFLLLNPVYGISFLSLCFYYLEKEYFLIVGSLLM